MDEILVYQLLPIVEIMIIIGSILVSLNRLRRFNSKYGLEVDMTKLWLYLFICMLLLAIFLVSFFTDKYISQAFWFD